MNSIRDILDAKCRIQILKEMKEARDRELARYPRIPYIGTLTTIRPAPPPPELEIPKPITYINTQQPRFITLVPEVRDIGSPPPDRYINRVGYIRKMN
jgi:hypothetical protein